MGVKILVGYLRTWHELVTFERIKNSYTCITYVFVVLYERMLKKHLHLNK